MISLRSLCCGLLIVVAGTTLGCAGKTGHVAAEVNARPGTGLGATEFRQLATELADTLVASAVLSAQESRLGRKLVLISGPIANRTAERIDTTLLANNLEAAILESGLVVVVASGAERVQLDGEQGSLGDPESVKATGRALGADSMTIGDLRLITDRVDRRENKFYRVDVRLVDLLTEEIQWAGSADIGKEISRDRFRW